MRLLTCRQCNAVFASGEQSFYCPDCSSLTAESKNKIREHLSSHPGSSVIDVSRATGLDTAVILRFLKRGTLTM